MRWVTAAGALALLLASGCVGEPRTTLVELGTTSFVFVEPTDQLYVEANATPPIPSDRATLAVGTPGIYVALWKKDEALDWRAFAVDVPLRFQELHPGPVSHPNRYQFCSKETVANDVRLTLIANTMRAHHTFSDVATCPVAGGP